jgi:fucose 4-O-acetylase-like acetyltransferase
MSKAFAALGSACFPSARSLGAVVAVIGGLVLVGWTFDVPALKSVLPGLVAMKVNTACCFVLGGLALWLLNGSPSPDRLVARRVAYLCATVMALVGLATLGEWVFGWMQSSSSDAARGKQR